MRSKKNLSINPDLLIIIGLKILNVTASSDTEISLISIEAQSQSPLIDPKFFLGNDLGLPITAPQYNFSADRKNVTAQFVYDDSVFDDNNFNLSVLLSDRNVALEYKTSVEPIIVSRLFAVNHSYIYIFLTNHEHFYHSDKQVLYL